MLLLGRPSREDREALLHRVRLAAAESPNRLATVEQVRREIADCMLVRLNRVGFVVTWAGLPWAGASPLRVEDRAWLAVAAQDAAVADLLADRLSPDDRDRLRAGWDVAASMPGLGFSGVPTFRGRLGIAVAIVAVVLVVATGALP